MQSECVFFCWTTHYANAYNIFTILDVSNSELQLSVQEMLCITKHQPILCKQKEF